ncbi:uncharacterized protein LOC106095336 isoform X1 [Stomoxys calcitrans]|uniref:Uncharacterized protein n=1 Tax=Stomoxys calcitrans TaxID=35570 RepID=A0A1I8P1M5_STOCA|nr:uncharacterized protein LOC106095336 isoform X1 [Stomoxys calcitrans]
MNGKELLNDERLRGENLKASVCDFLGEEALQAIEKQMQMGKQEIEMNPSSTKGAGLYERARKLLEEEAVRGKQKAAFSYASDTAGGYGSLSSYTKEIAFKEIHKLSLTKDVQDIQLPTTQTYALDHAVYA